MFEEIFFSFEIIQKLSFFSKFLICNESFKTIQKVQNESLALN